MNAFDLQRLAQGLQPAIQQSQPFIPNNGNPALANNTPAPQTTQAMPPAPVPQQQVQQPAGPQPSQTMTLINNMLNNLYSRLNPGAAAPAAQPQPAVQPQPVAPGLQGQYQQPQVDPRLLQALQPRIPGGV